MIPFGVQNLKQSPDWPGSVGWASSHKPKGHQLGGWSGHMAGLRVWFPISGGWE